MISLIEAIFGSKVGRLIAEVLLALIAIAAITLHFEHKGAVAELGKLQASSTQLITKANAQISKDADDYTAAQKTNQEKTDEARAAALALSNQLSDSVRNFDTYRRQHPDVSRSSGESGSAQPGECGAEDCGAVVERLAVRGNELAGSVGQLSAEVQGCQADRDALTGEPK